MKVWLVMHWDYAQTGPVAIFSTQEKAEAFVEKVAARYRKFGITDHGHSAAAYELDDEEPSWEPAQ